MSTKYQNRIQASFSSASAAAATSAWFGIWFLYIWYANMLNISETTNINLCLLFTFVYEYIWIMPIFAQHSPSGNQCLCVTGSPFGLCLYPKSTINSYCSLCIILVYRLFISGLHLIACAWFCLCIRPALPHCVQHHFNWVQQLILWGNSWTAHSLQLRWNWNKKDFWFNTSVWLRHTRWSK